MLAAENTKNAAISVQIILIHPFLRAMSKLGNASPATAKNIRSHATRRFIRRRLAFAEVTAAAAEAVRTTAGRITKSATARIIMNGMRGRRNACARQVLSMPATGRAMPAGTGMAVTVNTASANVPRDTPGTRRRGLAFVRGRIGALSTRTAGLWDTPGRAAPEQQSSVLSTQVMCIVCRRGKSSYFGLLVQI